MIFAAGLGTRLKPITDTIPKALLKVCNKTLLEYAIEKLKNAGVKEIIINVHAFADQIEQFVKSRNNFDLTIHFSDERSELLNTGGGLKHAQAFLRGSEPFFVYNVDVVSSIDLNVLLNKHIKNNALATLAVQRRKTSRYLLFNEFDELCAWENRNNEKKIIINDKSLLDALAFSGIQIIEPRFFDLLIEEGAFSLIDTYLRLAQTERIIAYDHTGDIWVDIGKINELSEAESIVKNYFSK